jgi:hypothetical protein
LTRIKSMLIVVCSSFICVYPLLANTSNYISPGFSIGYAFGEGWTYSAQITVGVVDLGDSGIAPDDELPSIGISIGTKWNQISRLLYCDFQGGLAWAGAGVGFGRYLIKDTATSYPVIRAKLYSGAIALVAYDLLYSPKIKPIQCMGIFAVLPIPLDGGFGGFGGF